MSEAALLAGLSIPILHMWMLDHCGTSSGCDPLPDHVDPDPLTLRPEPPGKAIPRNLDVFLARFVQLEIKSPNDTRKGEV